MKLDACASIGSLGILDSDSLLSILAKVPAKDHNTLRFTCKALLDVINSTDFCNERCRTGWAEAFATLVPPRVLFDEEKYSETTPSEDELNFQENYNDIGFREVTYGYQTIQAKIWVDGKHGGDSSMTLVPRTNRTTNFLESCDSISEEMQELSVQFCDHRGRNRLRSIQQAYYDHSEEPIGGFLYIDTFRLHSKYQMGTRTGAQALCSLLANTKLWGRWSLAVYNADSEAHFDDHDRKMNHQWRYGRKSQDQQNKAANDDPLRKWVKTRVVELQRKDMPQFFRAGFRQVKELRDSCYCYHMFAIPSFLKSNMITHEEALAIPIQDKRVMPEKPHGSDHDMLQFLIQQCSERSYRFNTEVAASLSDSFESTTAQLNAMKNEKLPGLSECLQSLEPKKLELQNRRDEIDEKINVCGKTAEEKEKLKEDRAHTVELLAVIQENERAIQATIADMNDFLAVTQLQIIEQRKNMIEKQREELRKFDERTRMEVQRFVEDEGASVEASHALHCCASRHVAEYIELLLEFVPPEKRVQAINGTDSGLHTPLMCAACRPGENEMKLRICTLLINLGADVSMVEPSGMTALGVFRSSRQSVIDYNHTFGLQTQAENLATIAQLETILKPPNGGTEADKALLDQLLDADNFSDDESDDFDEDDFDAEDESNEE